MPPSLRAILDRRELDLRLIGAGVPAAVDAPVTWVSGSDLPDPTPFLVDEQVLLTTGTWLTGAGRIEVAAYVERLVAAGVTGLGFGTEVVTSGTPDLLVDACADAGLPLFEVPYRTPFIAVIRYAADLIAEAERARDTWAINAQRAISFAALRPDATPSILAELSRQLGRWVALFDARGGLAGVHGVGAGNGGASGGGGGGGGGGGVRAVGRVRERVSAAGAGADAGAAGSNAVRSAAAAAAAAVAAPPADSVDAATGGGDLLVRTGAEALRLLQRGQRSSATITTESETVALQTLGRRGDLRGVLAIGGVGGLDGAAQTVVTSVVALAGLALEQGRALSRATGTLRSGLLTALLDGEVALVRNVTRQLGTPLPAEPVRVAVWTVSGGARDVLLADLEGLRERRPGVVFSAVRGPDVIACLPADRAYDLAREIVGVHGEAEGGETAGDGAGDSADRGAADRSADRSGVDRRANRSGVDRGADRGGVDRGAADRRAIDRSADRSAADRLHAGLSDPVPHSEIAAGVEQARLALDQRSGDEVSVTRFSDLAVGGVLGLFDAPQLEAVARAVLQPVLDVDRAEGSNLLESVSVWLSANGQWDPAAKRLGIHRHTLRSRITRVEQLTGHRLDAFEARTNLWLAIRSLP